MENDLTVRQKNILSYILKLKKLKVSDLCVKFNISDKTIRNEIKEINTITSKVLIKSSNQGIEINTAYIAFIYSLFNENEKNDDNLINKLIKLLLFENEAQDFYDLLDEFFISSSALSVLIKKANKMIERFDLTIVRKNNKIILTGNDYDKRRLIISMILNDNSNIFFSTDILEDTFTNIDTKKISEKVEKIIHEYGFYIPEYYFTSFMINIFTILTLPHNDEDNESESYDNATIENQIADSIIQELNISSTNHIRKEIADSLIGIINHNRANTHQLSDNISPDFSNKIIQLLKNTFDSFRITIDFESSIPVFVNHVYLMLQRAKNNYSSYLTENQIILKDSCMYIYDIALYFCKLLSIEFNVMIHESEVSLIAIHLGYYIEEACSTHNHINVALITEKYGMVDQYITNKINSDFYGKVNIISNDLTNKKIDLIITTRNLNQTRSNYCLITPLLTNSDKVKIQTAILDTINKKNKEYFKILAKKYFDPELFFYNERLYDKESVLEFLDIKLQRKKIIDEHFMEQIKKREDLSPTCFMELFALPHPFSCTALKSKIAVFINPNQILWTNDNRVQFVFLIAINENDQSTLKCVFDYFASILSDEMKMIQMQKVKTFNEFFDILTS